MPIPLPTASLHRVPQPSKTLPPAEDEIYKHKPWGKSHIKTTALTLYVHSVLKVLCISVLRRSLYLSMFGDYCSMFLKWRNKYLTKYGGMNVVGPHNLTGSGSIRMCSFDRVGMAFQEEVCHCGGGL